MKFGSITLTALVNGAALFGTGGSYGLTLNCLVMNMLGLNIAGIVAAEFAAAFLPKLVGFGSSLVVAAFIDTNRFVCVFIDLLAIEIVPASTTEGTLEGLLIIGAILDPQDIVTAVITDDVAMLIGCGFLMQAFARHIATLDGRLRVSGSGSDNAFLGNTV